MRNGFLRLIVWISAILLVGPSFLSAKEATIPGLDDIVSSRERLRDYVVDLKAKYKPADPEYTKGRDLYRDARDKYEGWLSQLKAGIVHGRMKDLRKDKTYQGIAESAGKAGQTFVDYAQEKTATTKGLPAFVSPLVDMGIKVWNAVKDRQQKDRDHLADYVGKEAEWPTWEKIDATSTAPTGAPKSDDKSK